MSDAAGFQGGVCAEVDDGSSAADSTVWWSWDMERGAHRRGLYLLLSSRAILASSSPVRGALSGGHGLSWAMPPHGICSYWAPIIWHRALVTFSFLGEYYEDKPDSSAAVFSPQPRAIPLSPFFCSASWDGCCWPFFWYKSPSLTCFGGAIPSFPASKDTLPSALSAEEI